MSQAQSSRRDPSAPLPASPVKGGIISLAAMTAQPPDDGSNAGPSIAAVPLDASEIEAHEAPHGGSWASMISKAVVVCLLAALAAWGHYRDWKVPKFSSLFGATAETEKDWCDEHSVPESVCIQCNAKLVAPQKEYGWCQEHGVAQCPLHHPEVAQLKSTPAIGAADMQRADLALKLVPRDTNNSHCNLHKQRIQFASEAAVEKMGVEPAVVEQSPVLEAISANGEIVYDETAAAHLASRVPGTVWRVEKQVGQPVQAGDVLALIDSVDVGRAKAELLHAIAQQRLTRATVERLLPLAKDGIVSGRRLRDAEAEAEEARIRLSSAQQALANLGLSVEPLQLASLSIDAISEKIRLLGLTPDDSTLSDRAAATSNLYPLRSPLSGIVVERRAVAGEVVDATNELFGVADVRRMWLTLDVRQEDAHHVALGQRVLFLPADAGRETEVQGAVRWISTSADPQTRTIKVRVELPNPDGSLRAHTFGTGRIVLRDEPNAALVPSEAIHWDGCCHVVFVRDKNYLQEGAYKFFYVRQVRTGVKVGDKTEIIAGLLPGEVIAGRNSVVLEAQLLKSTLGAGCGCCK